MIRRTHWLTAAALVGCITPLLNSSAPDRPRFIDSDVRRSVLNAIQFRGGLWRLVVERTPLIDAFTGKQIGFSLHVFIEKRNKGHDDLILAVLSFATFTASGTWTVSGTWNNASNKLECIGGGSDGDSGSSLNGGGAGAYANKSNQTYTGGHNITVTVGATGSVSVNAGDTIINNDANSATNVLAQGSQSRDGSNPPRAPGTAAASTGTVKFDGGTGGAGTVGVVGGAGGGAAGPNGAGNNGADTGGAGGSGDAGSGGAGGSAGGGNGSNGANLADGSHGSGGGGGGSSATGGTGGLYGAGGGGGTNLGAGTAGVIVISWTPSIQVLGSVSLLGAPVRRLQVIGY